MATTSKASGAPATTAKSAPPGQAPEAATIAVPGGRSGPQVVSIAGLRQMLSELAATASEKARRCRADAVQIIDSLTGDSRSAEADLLVAEAENFTGLAGRLREHLRQAPTAMTPRLAADLRAGRSLRLAKRQDRARARAAQRRLAGTAARARARLHIDRARAGRGCCAQGRRRSSRRTG
jgi:hypothetical protein